MAYTAYTRCTVVPLEILEVESEGQSGTTVQEMNLNERDISDIWLLVEQGQGRKAYIESHVSQTTEFASSGRSLSSLWANLASSDSVCDFNDVTYVRYQVPIIIMYP